MSTEIIVHGVEELDKVVIQSGLEKSEGDLVKENYLPFLERLAKVKEQSTKINAENPTLIDEKIARELRLETVDIRKRCEDVKDSRKKIHLLKGNLEQASFNLIKADCLLIEEAFTQVEKAREIAEKKRKAELKVARTELLQPFLEVLNPDFIDLENITDEAFDLIVSGAKLQIESKREAQKKAEEERLAAIEAERIRQEEMRLENERLKKEAEEKENQLQKEREEAAAKQKAIEDAAKAERDHAEKLRLAAESKAKKEREEAQKIADEKLAKEQAEKAKLEAELKAKKDAEEKERLRIEAEAKAKADAESKLAKSGDKKRLQAWVELYAIQPSSPEGLNAESIKIVTDIKNKHVSFIKWATEQINSI